MPPEHRFRSAKSRFVRIFVLDALAIRHLKSLTFPEQPPKLRLDVSVEGGKSMLSSLTNALGGALGAALNLVLELGLKLNLSSSGGGGLKL